MGRPAATRRGRVLLQIGVGCAALAVAAAGIAALFSDGPDRARQAAAPRAPSVETVAVTRGPQTIGITAWGVVEPARTVSVSSEVGGRIKEVSAALAPGRRVEADDVLARLARSDLEIEVRRAAADLAQARAELAVERGNQRVARAEAASKWTLSPRSVSPSAETTAQPDRRSGS